MSVDSLIFVLVTIGSTLTFTIAAWIYADYTFFRNDFKSILKAFGYLLLALAFAIRFLNILLPFNYETLAIWVQSFGLWLIFASFVFDSHTKLSIVTITAILSLVFLRSHALLAVQTLIIALTILDLAYITKHRNFIYLGVSFLLMTVAEFFWFLGSVKMYESSLTAPYFLYVFAQIIFAKWLIAYIKTRIQEKHPIKSLIV